MKQGPKKKQPTPPPTEGFQCPTCGVVITALLLRPATPGPESVEAIVDLEPCGHAAKVTCLLGYT